MTLNSTTSKPTPTTVDSSYLTDAAFNFKLNAYEFKVYFYLTRSANPLGQITQGVVAIAKDCFLNRKTVARILNSLIRMGMLRCLTRGGNCIHELTMPPEWVERQTKVLILKKGIGVRSQESDVGYGADKNGYAADKDGYAADKNGYAADKNGYAADKNGYAADTPASCKPPLGGVCDEAEQQGYGTDNDDLDSRLCAARRRGWLAGVSWEGGMKVVRVDGFAMSVAEFMKRPLDSFDRAKDFCAEGLAKCHAVIKRIKQQRQREFVHCQ